MSSARNRDAFLRIVESKASLDERFTGLTRIDPLGGAGFFSLLLKARDEHNGRPVAIKVFTPDQRHDAYRVAAFAREAGLLARFVGQPDIVQSVAGLSEFVEELKTEVGVVLQVPFAYYAMELAEGDLAEAIAYDLLSIDDQLVAFHQACRAVQRLHAERIAHRDLKPSNFLFVKGRQIKLGDLGTARRFDGRTPALVPNYTGWMGDYRYAAPEVCGNLHNEVPAVAFLADFYSLGAILFELVTGINFNSRVYDARFFQELAAHTSVIPAGKRKAIYDQLVADIVRSHPLPSISDYRSDLPACLVTRVNELCQTLCCIDYRDRLADFRRVFGRVQAARLEYRNMRDQQRKLEEKRNRRSAKAVTVRLQQ